MPEPGLTVWLLGFPLIVAVVDLVRTLGALKRTPRSSTRDGAWSRALHIDA